MKLSIINVSYENEILHEGYGKQQGIALGVPTMKGSYDDPENIKRGYNSIIDTFGNHDVPQGWIHTPRPNTTPNTNPGPPVSWNDPTSLMTHRLVMVTFQTILRRRKPSSITMTTSVARLILPMIRVTPIIIERTLIRWAQF